MVAANMGEVPQSSRSGELGYTVQQTMRLLGLSDSTVRKHFASQMLTGASGRSLCPATEVLVERSLLLDGLGAVDAGDVPNTGEGLQIEVQELRICLSKAEERIRLIVAARSAARDREVSAHAEERAYLEIALMELDPLR
jgi:hypothetical protein